MSTGDSDQTRFARLVLPHLGAAYRLAEWITGNRADAEDVVQDVCIQAFGTIGIVPEATPRDRLLTMVRYCANKWIRKNRPRAVVAVDDLEPDESRQVTHWNLVLETPETVLISKVGAERLADAIGGLPMPFREVLVLRDIQGLSYSEIAEVTGVPVGTVMSRLARGRNRVIRSIGKKLS